MKSCTTDTLKPRARGDSNYELVGVKPNIGGFSEHPLGVHWGVHWGKGPAAPGHPEAFLVAQFSRQAIRSPRTIFFPYQSACSSKEIIYLDVLAIQHNTKHLTYLTQHRTIRTSRRRPHTHSRHELLVPDSGAEDICPSSCPGPCHAGSGAEEPCTGPIAGSLPRSKTDLHRARASDCFDFRQGMGASILG